MNKLTFFDKFFIAITFLVIYLIGLNLFIYLIGSFITFDFNPFHWKLFSDIELVRILFLMELIIYGFLILIAHGKE